jgi:hypothetical protein
MPDIHQQYKACVAQLSRALYDLDPQTLPRQLESIFTPDCAIHLSFPFEDLNGPRELYETVYAPLLRAIPDLERRDFIRMAGPAADGSNWVGWYGPAGIGANRRISGFRNWHQIPFLKALPTRGMNPEATHYEFADGNFVGITAWPNMRCTILHDGWLGIAPAGQEIKMRSLDFWRCENGLIRENWVLVDLLSVYNQIGVDVFSRMKEFTVERQAVKPAL